MYNKCSGDLRTYYHIGAALRIVYAYQPSNTIVLQDINIGNLYYLSYDGNDEGSEGNVNNISEYDLFDGIYYAG
ncbi:MAG: hypothetical protein J5685_04770 [Clostridiales bacterium]|nr:hypothetical protein [Clostridiales bacterium]